MWIKTKIKIDGRPLDLELNVHDLLTQLAAATATVKGSGGVGALKNCGEASKAIGINRGLLRAVCNQMGKEGIRFFDSQTINEIAQWIVAHPQFTIKKGLPKPQTEQSAEDSEIRSVVDIVYRTGKFPDWWIQKRRAENAKAKAKKNSQ
jgi:hypothetical protein